MTTAWVVKCDRGCWEAWPVRAKARFRRRVLNAPWKHVLAQIRQHGSATVGTSVCAEKHRIVRCREAA